MNERQNDPIQRLLNQHTIDVPNPPQDEWKNIQTRILTKARFESKLKRLFWVAAPVATTLILVQQLALQTDPQMDPNMNTQLSGELLSIVEGVDPLNPASDPTSATEPLVGEHYLSLLALVEQR